MYRKLLVAYDGSPSSQRAFSAALELAGLFKAELIILSIATPPQPASEEETEASVDSSRDYFDRMFAGMRQRAVSVGIAAAFEVRVGHPSRHIVDYAEQSNADLIIMGHRGHGLLGRLVLGSVAKQVIDLTTCPVLVVR
jgi:nucleotide-binding universal stress UspA family protein